ncbi:MAG: hypothetical protein H7Z14_22150 [Anaerolineae bacterium]|nr:hypothetical protein [Phycisphaerae bacterium]
MHSITIAAGILCAIALCSSGAMAQAEMNGWGNLRGLRIDGELIPITTSIAIASPGWKESAQTAHWRTRKSTYTHEGDAILVTGEISIARGPAVTFRQTVKSSASGAATIELELTAQGDLDLEGAYFFVKVPASLFASGSGQLLGAQSGSGERVSFATTRPANDKHYTGDTATGAKFSAPRREIEVTFDQPRVAVFQDGRADHESCLTLFFKLHDGSLKAQQTIRSTIAIKTSGEVDRPPATVTIDTSQPGATFEGMGGNFCWGSQSPTVPYYLDNARIVWGRVSFAMPLWQPHESDNPATRPVDELPDEIRESLRMSRELHRRKIPIIVSVWNAPEWAHAARENDRGPRRGAARIDPAKWDAFAKSIGRYLLMFKEQVGAEPAMFSFNESNLGINVLMSPEEHRDMLKRLGAHFESLGLKTKMLLGDANEPRAVDYVNAALADPEAMKYVGMVSYHSWNGGTDEQLIGWRNHARRAGVPLIIAEAGTDPDAHQYRNIISEPWYAVEEAENNLRCLTLSQPASIMHWQLTPDYGMVSAGKNDGDPIQPSRRWWQFKQLADLSPATATIFATKCDQPAITVAALGETTSVASAVHFSNVGAERKARINGLPTGAKFHCYVTDGDRNMKQSDELLTSNDAIELTLPAQSLVTLVAEKR